MVVDVSVEPLWVGERALREDNSRSRSLPGAACLQFRGGRSTYIAVLPLTYESLRAFGVQAAAGRHLAAGGQVGTRPEHLRADELELAVVVVEVGVDLQLCGAAHGNECAIIPEASVFICEEEIKVK